MQEGNLHSEYLSIKDRFLNAIYDEPRNLKGESHRTSSFHRVLAAGEWRGSQTPALIFEQKLGSTISQVLNVASAPHSGAAHKTELGGWWSMSRAGVSFEA